MKKRNVIIIVIVVLIVIGGITFGIFQLIDSIQKENQDVENNKEEIRLLYDELNENAEEFNSKKEEYDALMDQIFYTNVVENNEELTKILKEYDEIIGKIIETGNALGDKCTGYYTDSDINQKCNSYKISYESAMQVFISDVDRYNTLVANYNEWTEENSGYEKITEFVSENVQ